MSISHAFTRWSEILDHERIIHKEEVYKRYGENTTSSVRVIEGALRPVTQEEIQKIVHIALEERVPLYPISTGHNWGYGTALPSGENNVILDLSLMNRIIDCDPKLGIVTVEPGVTLQNLYEYLEKNNLPFLVPLTGAGLHGSLIGNALERGFGVTPFADHFSAVTTVTAVLVDGTVYNSPLDEYGCERIAKLYRYDVGPYLNGIFTQGNFGIVTRMTIALARKPEATSMFLFSLESDKELRILADELPYLLSVLGSTTSGFKFVDSHQMEAMAEGKNSKSSISFPKWTITGGLFGDPKMIAVAKKIMRKKMNGKTHKLIFVNVNFIEKYKYLTKFLPLSPSLKHFLETASLMVDLFSGKPSTAALPLAYLGSGTFPKVRNDADPGKDGAGIIWFAPLIPMDGKFVVQYCELIKSTLKKYHLPQMVTLTTINDRCFDAPLPIVFDKNNEESIRNAKACYDELWNESKKVGIMPYRIPIDEQYRVTESGTPFWDIAEKIKNALDPHNIISPKRYSKK